MRYLKVNDKCFITEQEVVKQEKQETVPEKVNHIFIYDRSGSMYGVLSHLAKDMKSRLRTVPNGDTVTIGWFSSPGEFRFVLKGLKITGEEDYKTLDKVIDANDTTLGMTCFSEILGDTKQVVEDLSAISNKFAMIFFTDGYPTVYPYEKEVKAIEKAIKAISGKITASLLVGYGNYYNKELMSSMAEQLGGSLIHNSDLKNFPIVVDEFMTRVRDGEGRIKVEVEAKSPTVVFSLPGGQVTVHQVEDGSILFSPTKNATDRVFSLTKDKPVGTEVKLPAKGTKFSAELEPMVKAMYAAAYVLTQRTKADEALDVLSALGDAALIDRVNNAFTNAEYGAAEQSMLDAIGKPQLRFSSGRKANYMPSPDAFCLLDALDILMSDDEAFFYPYHDEFSYSRIGVGSKTKPGYPKFEADKSTRVPLSGLVWNDTKLNLSIRAKIPGTIALNDDYKKLGLPAEYNTFIWRNYALVRDGFLNVQSLPVTLSKESYDKFLAEGVIDKEANGRHYKGRAYVLHLDRIPVINRKVADGKTSAKDLCKLAYDELAAQGALKVLNFLRSEVEPKDQSLGDDNLTPEQEEFLKAHGVTKGGYNPPTESLPPTDFYMAKEFEIKIKGMSSLPKIDDVRKKVAEKKNLTPSMKLISDWLARYDRKPIDKNKFVAEMNNEIAKFKISLAYTRSQIQRTKFGIILAKKPLDGITSRDDMTIMLNDQEFTFNMRNVKVDI